MPSEPFWGAGHLSYLPLKTQFASLERFPQACPAWSENILGIFGGQAEGQEKTAAGAVLFCLSKDANKSSRAAGNRTRSKRTPCARTTGILRPVILNYKIFTSFPASITLWSLIVSGAFMTILNREFSQGTILNISTPRSLVCAISARY